MDKTTVIAILGAIISTILLILRFRDRADKKRNLRLFLHRVTVLNEDQYNYHNGRKGEQYLSIKITNRSSDINSVQDIYLVSFRKKFIVLKNQPKKIKLTFSHNAKLPFGLAYTGQAQIDYPLNMLSHEFHKSWKCNIKVIQEMNDEYIQAIVVDTHLGTHKSNKIKITTLIADFFENEKILTHEEYRKENY